MYARVVTAQYQPGKMDEGRQIFFNSSLPAARRQPGYKGGLALEDRTTGKAIAIGLRETAADMQATEASGFLQEQLAKMMHLFAGTPTVEAYEVSIQEIQKGGPGGYARMLSATVQSGKMDEGIQIVRDSVLPAARQQPGYRGYLLFTDRSSGKAVAITLWETEADRNAGESSGYVREQLGKVAHLSVGQIVQEAYEVVMQE